MKLLKILKTAVKMLFYAAIVIAIEHAVLFSVAVIKHYGPVAGERIETFDSFVFLVSPKPDNGTNLSSDQLLVAEIRNNELADQTHEDVLNNKCGPIALIGKYNNEGYFEDLNLKTDLSLYELQSASDLKIKLDNRGYYKSEKMISQLYRPLPFPLSDFPGSLAIVEKEEEFPPYILIYNDKYIRTCSSSVGNRFQMDYDYVYSVNDDNEITVHRNTCQIYSFD